MLLVCTYPKKKKKLYATFIQIFLFTNTICITCQIISLLIQFVADLSLYDLMLEGNYTELFLALQNPKKCLCPFWNIG